MVVWILNGRHEFSIPRCKLECDYCCFVNVGDRFANSGERMQVRLYLANDSGYYLDMNIYREVIDERTGEVSSLKQFFVDDLISAINT